jgi:hypothetical protein
MVGTPLCPFYFALDKKFICDIISIEFNPTAVEILRKPLCKQQTFFGLNSFLILSGNEKTRSPFCCTFSIKAWKIYGILAVVIFEKSKKLQQALNYN